MAAIRRRSSQAGMMAESGTERWNYRVLLGQGIASNVGYELTSDRLVLPFLYAAAGAPVFFAGLLVPMVTVARLVAQIIIAPIIHAARSNKWFMAVATITTALALILVSATVNSGSPGLVVVVFLFVAAVLGASAGVASLAFRDMLGRVLPMRQRTRLLFAQSGLAGIVTVAVAFGAQKIEPRATSLAAHQELIWLGIAVTVIAAIVTCVVREPAKVRAMNDEHALRIHKGHIENLRASFRIAFRLSWFPRFLVARALFLSIELAMPFYSVHAAQFHGNNSSGLSTFIIASSVGLLLGGFIWPRVGKDSIRLVLAAAAGATCIGGVLALAIENQPILQTPLIYAVVFTLVAFGAQGIVNGRTVYLIGRTSDDERPFCLAVANLVISFAAIGLGVIAGTLAQLDGIVFPLFVIIGLNIVAVLYTLTMLEDVHPPATAATAGLAPTEV
jgi:hypothetical protein